MNVSEYLVALTKGNFLQKLFYAWLDLNHPIEQPVHNAVKGGISPEIIHQFTFIERLFFRITFGVIGVLALAFGIIFTMKMPGAGLVIFVPSF